MTIDTDVAQVAAQFDLDPRLLQAVVNAEGGGTAILRAVQCSVPSVTTRAAALRILARSACHALCDFAKQADHAPDFVAFWGARWAPDNVANDPTHLNRNWATNVLSLWTEAA